MIARRWRVVGLASVALFSLSLVTDASATGATDSLQREINAVLAKTEGGTQISRNEIAWEGGEVIMALPLPGEVYAPPSSPAARKLQAEVAAKKPSEAESRTPRRAVSEMAEDPGGAAADEPVPAGEEEPVTNPRAADNCPTEVFGNDWYCFYQFKNFGGRRLQWNASHPYDTPVYFSSYDFVNRTSSWSNKGGMYIYAMGRAKSGSDWSCRPNTIGITLWEERDHSRSASVPASLDNRADCFFTY